VHERNGILPEQLHQTVKRNVTAMCASTIGRLVPRSLHICRRHAKPLCQIASHTSASRSAAEPS
jgi:hypothetical protein